MGGLLADHGSLAFDGDARLGLLREDLGFLSYLLVLILLLLDINSMYVSIKCLVSRQFLNINTIKASLLTEHPSKVIGTPMILARLQIYHSFLLRGEVVRLLLLFSDHLHRGSPTDVSGI